jgi:hypothetical protein
MDESQKRAAVVGALLLGHKSSHQRALRLTVASGVKRPSVPAERSLETATGATHSGVAYASPKF